MHFDRRKPETWQRVDYWLVRDSPNLYWRPLIFDDDLNGLASLGYRVESFDASDWHGPGDEQSATARALGFPHSDYSDGGNWDSWRDFILDLEWIEEELLALGFRNFEVLFRRDEQRARVLLEILAEATRFHLLFGRHLVVLVQTNDSAMRIENLDPVFAKWNNREWHNQARWDGPPPTETPPPFRVSSGSDQSRP